VRAPDQAAADGRDDQDLHEEEGRTSAAEVEHHDRHSFHYHMIESMASY
jgi:hypothetical protein